MAQIGQNRPIFGVLYAKNTFRDEGSTSPLTAYTDDNVDIDTAYTVYTIETALHC